MPSVRPVGSAFSPLDEELGFLPGRYSPRVQEAVVRLATHLPFRQAVRECEWFVGVAPAEATARRLTQAAGAAQVACQQAARSGVEHSRCAGPPGPALQQVSVDGAMVPLVGGQWAEVKTAAIGTVLGTRASATGEPVVHTADWSYFSRLADAETFAREALVELHARGTATAGTVVAPVDGSTWCQTFFDLHRPDAVRILDFPHAAEHVSVPVRAVWGQGSEATQAWLDEWLPKLKAGATTDVLEALCLLPVEQAGDPTAATAARAEAIAYLAARWDQLQYGQFVAAGYPIGSGSVESANKLVVEVRLKGAGMHWTRAPVNPLLALRNLVCNDRWADAWPQIVQYQRQQVAGQRRARHAVRPPITPPPPLPVAPPPPAIAPRRPPRIVDGRPTAAHPWKRRLIKDLPNRHRLPALPKS